MIAHFHRDNLGAGRRPDGAARLRLLMPSSERSAVRDAAHWAPVRGQARRRNPPLGQFLLSEIHERRGSGTVQPRQVVSVAPRRCHHSAVAAPWHIAGVGSCTPPVMARYISPAPPSGAFRWVSVARTARFNPRKMGTSEAFGRRPAGCGLFTPQSLPPASQRFGSRCRRYVVGDQPCIAANPSR